MRNADTQIVDILDGKVQFMSRLVSGADSKTFERLGGSWARDARHVYFAGQRCAKIDAPSFRRLNQSFGIDKKGAFFKMIFFADADPETFQALDSGLLLYEVGIFSGEDTRGYAKDANQVWFGHLKVRDADAKSFWSLGNGYGRDKSSVYYREKRIAGADITSWRHWRADISLDEQNIYYCWKRIKDVDRKSVTHLSRQNCIVDRHGVFVHDKRVTVEKYLPLSEYSVEREMLTEMKFFDRLMDEWPNCQ